MEESLALFYSSLLKQNPKSQMAIKWCLKNKMEKHVQKYADKKTYNNIKKGMEICKIKKKKTEKVKGLSQKMENLSLESKSKKKKKN